MSTNKDYPELDKAFYGRGGDDLRLWLCENGHINTDLKDDPKAVIEYEFALRLFNDAGFGLLPIPLPQEEEKEETNVIDDILEKE